MLNGDSVIHRCTVMVLWPYGIPHLRMPVHAFTCVKREFHFGELKVYSRKFTLYIPDEQKRTDMETGSEQLFMKYNNINLFSQILNDYYIHRNVMLSSQLMNETDIAASLQQNIYTRVRNCNCDRMSYLCRAAFENVRNC